MKNILYSVLAGLCLALGSPELPAAIPQPLSPGDTIPPALLAYIQARASASIATPLRLNGKLVILDFWATWCISCIHAMPRLDSLQEQFAGSVQVIAVTTEPQQQLDRFFQRHPRLRSARIPYISGDSLLSAAFPHHLIPHTVWLGRDTSLYAQTLPDALDSATIAAALAGNAYAGLQKIDMVGYSPGKALAAQPLPGLSKALVARSALYAGLPGIAAAEAAYDEPDGYLHLFLNMPLLDIYSRLTGESGMARRLLVAGARPHQQDSIRQLLQTAFSYEVELPPGTTPAAFAGWAMADLGQQCKLRARLEQRVLPCRQLQAAASPRRVATGNFSLAQVAYRLNEMDTAITGAHLYVPAPDTGIARYPLPPPGLTSPAGLQLWLAAQGIEAKPAAARVKAFVVQAP